LALDARLAYIENEILQADPIRLVQLLYRGAIEALGKARVHIEEADISARSRQITKTSEIINELTLSIDREKGGDLATNLVELYDYMQRRLQDANFRQDTEPLTEVERLLATLLEAWDQCAPVAQFRPAATTAPEMPPAQPALLDDATYAPLRAAGYY